MNLLILKYKNLVHSIYSYKKNYMQKRELENKVRKESVSITLFYYIFLIFFLVLNNLNKLKQDSLNNLVVMKDFKLIKIKIVIFFIT